MDLTSSPVRCHSGLRQSELTPRASQLSGLRVMFSRNPCNMHSAAAEIRTRNRSATARMPRSVSTGPKLPVESPSRRCRSGTVSCDCEFRRLGQAQVLEGPSMQLADAEVLCAFARFCDPNGQVWNEVKDSNDPKVRVQFLQPSYNAIASVDFTVSCYTVGPAGRVRQMAVRLHRRLADLRSRGRLLTLQMVLRIGTGIFAGILAFHNTITRYIFAMGREGLVWRPLANTHPRRQSPYIAGLAQTLVEIAVIAVFAGTKQDPYAILFAWMSAIATLGILINQVLVSLAVIGFFRRTQLDRRVWHTIVSPTLAAVGLLVFFVLVWGNLDL